jgi:membrane-associated phospholipid phosphatase
MLNYFDNICKNSPDLFLIITILGLLHVNNYALILFFCLGFIVNNTLNRYLENIIFKKDNELTLLSQDDNEKHNDIPSGHLQSTTFCFIFYLLSNNNNYTKNIFIIFIYLFLYIFCTCHIILYKYHTIVDVISGMFFGTLFSYVYFKFISYTKIIKR